MSGQIHNLDKTAIVTGCTGQIGSYLCEYLLGQSYRKVVGIARRVSNPNTERLEECLGEPGFVLAQGDVTDPFSLQKVFSENITSQNERYEVYNLAAASHVHTSFAQPKLYADITGIGHLNVLETCLPYHRQGFNLRLYYQSSSEVFGGEKSPSGFQTIDTRMNPNSPYAAAKLYAFHLNRLYRESYGLWASSGIIFNTESPRRGEDFVTRKITKWFGELLANPGKYKNKLKLGNINSCRDWMHARDCVRAIHLINTAQRPKDYLVSSGETHSVLNFMEECYRVAQNILPGHTFFPSNDLNKLYEIDQSFFRPNEVPYLKGQSDIIREELDWKPQISFKELVDEMVRNDYRIAKLRNIND